MGHHYKIITVTTGRYAIIRVVKIESPPDKPVTQNRDKKPSFSSFPTHPQQQLVVHRVPHQHPHSLPASDILFFALINPYHRAELIGQED